MTSGDQTTSGSKMILTMGLVACICGVLIVAAFQGTQEAIADNKRITLERAVFKVLPGAATVREYVATPAGIQPLAGNVPEGGIKFYAAYDQSGALKGIAAEAAGKGYADTVRVLYGYDAQRQCIVGIGVVSMRETPGIGDKILTDAAFLKNFEALDVRVNAEMTALANAVKTVKHGTKTNPWQIDAIAGATVTSKAVGRGINESAQKLMPLLVPHLDSVKGEEGREKGKDPSAALTSPFTLLPSPFPNGGDQT
ncbi:MAG TPA: FMN-binding protein [Gallionella sp.]|nr:FMN-binding protein [Gallionella sp.]